MARHRLRKQKRRLAHAWRRDNRYPDAEDTANERRNVARDHRRSAAAEEKRR